MAEVLTRLSQDLARASASLIVAEREPGDAEKLEQAADEIKVAVFDYKKPSDREYQRRIVRVEGYAFGRVSKHEYIRAYDYERQGLRSFRISRILPGSVKVAR